MGSSLARAPISYEPRGEWFDGEIRRFVRLDNADPPALGGILFVGSSIFREWREARDFDADFAPLPVLNRAFGGSQTDDLLDDAVLEAVVFPHRPRVIVYYCGSNDLNWGVPPERIRDNFACFHRAVRARLGSARDPVRILFVSINRAPQKRPVWRQLDAANALVAAHCAATPNLAFVDVNPRLFESGDASGEDFRARLFRDDGLHFRPEAYDEFLPDVREAVEKAWNEARGEEADGATGGGGGGGGGAGGGGTSTSRPACDREGRGVLVAHVKISARRTF